MEDFSQYEPPRNWWDSLLTLGVGLLVYELLALWCYPILHPSVWEEVAVAAGLRVPALPYPGVYRAILRMLFCAFPAGEVLDLLPILGRASMAVSAMFVYLVFRDLLPPLLWVRAQMARIGRASALFAALLFVCADPVWRAGQVFSPVSLFLLLSTGAGWCLFRFLRKGAWGAIVLCLTLLGLVAADSLFGILFAVVALVVVVLAVNQTLRTFTPLVNPRVAEVVHGSTFKNLTCLVLGVSTVTFALNVRQQDLVGGHSLELLLTIVREITQSVRTAVTPVGWLFVLLFSLAPLIFTLKVLSRARNDDKFLPGSVGAICLGAGVVSLTQLAGAPVLWFWTWGGGRALVTSDAVLAVILGFNVATCACVVAVFGRDVWCRNYRRIAQQQFPESMLQEKPAQMAESLARTRPLRMLIFDVFLLLALASVVVGRRQKLERGMLALMGAYEREFLAETKSCDWIFTDGAFDRLHELEGLRRGHVQTCVSVLTPNTANVALEKLEGEAGELLRTNGREALRTWIEQKDARLKTAAVQQSFELWQAAKLDVPTLSGVAAFPGGAPKDEVARARAAVERLIMQIRAFQTKFVPSATPDFKLRAKYPFVLFRLARLAQIRAWVASQAHRHDEAKRERACAEELDAANYELTAFRQRIDAWKARKSGEAFSPREGLMIGLSRGDFSFAGKYASPILRKDPDDPRANFAVGMKYLQERNWARAEPFFKRALVRRPNEATLLNNLAIVQLNLRHLSEAEANARKALAAQPNVPEIRRTLDLILKARAEQKPIPTEGRW